MSSLHMQNMIHYFPNLPYFIATAALLAIPTLYYWCLPRVVPGIPYNPKSARRVMGDVPDLIKHVKKETELCGFFARQCTDLKSPLVQIFLQPLAKLPLLILSDYREIEDILTKRTKEFDRAKMTADVFESILPHGTIRMPSHEGFRSVRRMWAPTMSTTFLHQAAASHIYASTLELVALWRRKAFLAQDHPFQAHDDFQYVTLDAIWLITLGKPLRAIESQLQAVNELQSLDLPSSLVEPAAFPPAKLPAICAAVEALINCIPGIAQSPFPRTYQFFMRQRSWYRRTWNIKEETMSRIIAECRQAFDKDTDPDGAASSAMELVLKREHSQALKSGTVRDDGDRQMKDELFTFLVAGNETTATTLSWTVKFLASAQDVQECLRKALQAKLSPDSTEQFPPAQDIVSADVPYLDATIAECLRTSCTAGGAIRQATMDTEILGHHIPAGANLFFAMNGDPYLYADDMDIDEEKRSTTSRAAADKYHAWDQTGKRIFRPERWLKKEGDGSTTFDPNAGPYMPFSAGPRGCFGKKLAWLELRMIIAMLVLSFELKPLPEELNDNAAEELVTRRPKQCYVRLTPL